MTIETYLDFLIMRLERLEDEYSKYNNPEGSETLEETIITLKHLALVSRKRKAIERAIAEIEGHMEGHSA